MVYNDYLIKGNVPKAVRNRTRVNMEKYHMDLYDAFKDAVRKYGKSKNLRNAFCKDDYRLYIPYAYTKEYLNFDKYPLKYKVMTGGSYR